MNPFRTLYLVLLVLVGMMLVLHALDVVDVDRAWTASVAAIDGAI